MKPKLRRPRTPGLGLLLLCLLLFGGGLFVAQLASAPTWQTLLGAGLVGVSPLLLEGLALGVGHRAEELVTRRTSLPDATGRVLPRVRTLEFPDFGVHPSTVEFAYVPRAHDDQCRRTLEQHRKVLAVGRSMSGKTRLAVESVKSLFPRYAIWRPVNAEAILTLLRTGHRLERTVVWLDDLERFTSSSLAPHHLDALQGSSNVVVATVRANIFDGLRFPGGNRLVAFDLVTWFGRPVWVTPWTDTEIDAVLTDAPSTLPVDALRKHGLSGYLGGAGYLLERWQLSQTLGDHTETLVRALVDLYRCGFVDGVPEATLRNSPGTRAVDDEQFVQALAWCSVEVAPGISMVDSSDGLLTLSEVVLEEFEHAEVPSPTDAWWDFACETADQDALVGVGEAARLHERPDVAERAWRASGTPLAGAHLGVLILNQLYVHNSTADGNVAADTGTGTIEGARTGNEPDDNAHPGPRTDPDTDTEVGEDRDDSEEIKLGEAVGLLRVALDADVKVETPLAVALEKLAGGEHADIDEAFELYCRAAEYGDALAAYNAGMYLMRRRYTNTEDAAEQYMRQAFDGGHRLAAGRLATLLDERGAPDESLHFLSIAAESNDGDPDDQARYGQMLLIEGDEVRGRVHLERAYERGSHRGQFWLARQLLKSSKQSELGRAARLLDSLDPEFVKVDRDQVQALRGSAAIERGLLAEGEAILRAGHAEGGDECGLRLAQFLLNSEVLERERLYGQVGKFDIPDEVVSILAEQGAHDVEAASMLMGIYFNFADLDQAIDYSEKAFAAHSDPAMGAQLASTLLARRGEGDAVRAHQLLIDALGVLEGSDQYRPDLDHVIALHNNLGLALRALGEDRAAEAHLLQAARAGGINAMGNLAKLLQDLGGVRRKARARYWGRRLVAAHEAYRGRERRLIGSTYLSTHVARAEARDRQTVLDVLIRRLTRIQLGLSRCPSRPGLSSIWAICHRCRTPFEVRSGAYLTLAALDEDALMLVDACPVRVRPCPYCFRRGRVLQTAHPLLELVWLEDGFTIAPNNSRTYRAVMGICTDLVAGNITLDEAVEWLRTSATPLARLGDAFAESAPSSKTAAGLLAAVVCLVGSDMFSDGEDLSSDDEAELHEAIDAVLGAAALIGGVPATTHRAVGSQLLVVE